MMLNALAENCCNNQSSNRHVCSSSGGEDITAGLTGKSSDLEVTLSAVSAATNGVWWGKSACTSLNFLQALIDRISTLAEGTKYTSYLVERLPKVEGDLHTHMPRHFRVSSATSQQSSVGLP